MDHNNSNGISFEVNLKLVKDGEVEELFLKQLVERVEKDLRLQIRCILRSLLEDSMPDFGHQEGGSVLTTQHPSHGNVLKVQSPSDADLPKSPEQSSNNSPGVSESHLQVVNNEETNMKNELIVEKTAAAATKNNAGTMETIE